MLEINKIHNMDCLVGLGMLDDNSVDSIVTDPPYEYNFMNKMWDQSGISYNTNVWKECLRVLKPGGYLLSFAGARTFHRITCAIEDAGFIIHPLIAWINGQGFPKATNLSKRFDKETGVEREVVRIDDSFIKRNPNNTGIHTIVTKADGTTLDGRKTPSRKNKIAGSITASTTPEVKQWDGWYYGLQSLKPAVEPICMAQKPIDGKRMMDNVLKWGVGAVNIGESRLSMKPRKTGTKPNSENPTGSGNTLVGNNKNRPAEYDLKNKGRFPANVIFDEFAGKILDKQSGDSKSIKSMRGIGLSDSNIYGKGDKKYDTIRGHNDSGGASRFFKNIKYTEDDFVGFYYCSKASRKDRGEYNKHTTVKPIKLIKYLIKLITPLNGLCLDPFIGSGTTALACAELGFDYIGFEIEKEYCEIAERRIAEREGQK